jgi:hypothetical protein
LQQIFLDARKFHAVSGNFTRVIRVKFTSKFHTRCAEADFVGFCPVFGDCGSWDFRWHRQCLQLDRTQSATTERKGVDMYVVKFRFFGKLGFLWALFARRCAALLLALSALAAAGDGLPQILIQPSNQTAFVFGSAMFSVTVTNAAQTDYQWVFNGEPVANATNADLILGPLTVAQNGYYNVIISNSVGAISSSKAQLTVYQAIVSNTNLTEAQDAQEFLLQFTNVMVTAAGSFGVFTLKSDGTVAGYDLDVSSLDVPDGLSGVVAISAAEESAIALTEEGTVVTWGEPDQTTVAVALSNIIAVAAGPNSYNIALQSNGMVAEWENEQSVVTPPLRLPFLSNTVAIAAGDSQFLALNANGTVTQWQGENEVSEVSGLSNVIAISAGIGSLALKVDGTVTGWDGLATNPLPSVSNGVAIAVGGSEFLVLRADGTVATSTPGLSFPLAVSNAFAVMGPSAVGGIALVGDGSPVFTLQPGNQILMNEVTTVWLHARAVGVQPMSYQWQLDGTNIPGATDADLTITNAQPDQAGVYSAVASNGVGVASSRLAVVTIPVATNSYTLGQALNATNLVWSSSSSSSAPWFVETSITHDGVAAAQSAPIGNSMESILRTMVTGPGTVTFWWMVSSEEYFDILSFAIDIVASPVTNISGEVGWERESFSVGAGVHSLWWIYAKDPDVSVGLDAGWVDQVSFIPDVPAQLGVPALSLDGTLRFSLYTADGSALAVTDPAALTFEASSNLVDWIPLTNALTLTNGAALLTDPAVTNSPVRFYRVMPQ